MENWYKENPGLLEREIRDLKDNGILVDDTNLTSEAFERTGVIVDCVIPAKNTLGLNLEFDLGLKIIFPSNYPYFRPEVYVTSGINLPRHQNPLGKNLCLIPRPTQFWNPEETLFKFLKERLPLVLVKGKITDQEVIGMDPDEQAEPVSEYYTQSTNTVVLSARPKIESEPIPPQKETFEILDHGFLYLSHNLYGDNVQFTKPSPDSKTFKIILEKWSDSNDDVIGEIPFDKILKQNNKYKTKWYIINSLEKLLCNSDSFNWLIAELKRNDIQQPKSVQISTMGYKIDHVIALLFPEEEIAGKIDWGWVLFVDGYVVRKVKGRGKRSIVRSPAPMVLPIMSLEQSELFSRIPQSEVLKNKTISVIGLGSLGAPSALEFARNGVKELRLMDFDIVEVTSSVRWPLGIESAGVLKTVALQNFIRKNYPGVRVKIFHHRIGVADQISFPNENEKLDELLETTDLVYDASAEEGVNNLISTLCREKQIPYVEIEGRRGAWGGLVMRQLPEKSKGCWMCLQYSIFDKTITPPKDDNNGLIQPKGCGDRTFTGASYDMQNISLAGVRMVIATLSGAKISGDWDVAILSMVDNKNRPIVPSWTPYSLEINPKCPFCNANSLD